MKGNSKHTNILPFVVSMESYSDFHFALFFVCAGKRGSSLHRKLRNEALLCPRHSWRLTKVVSAFTGEHAVLFTTAHHQRHVLSACVSTLGRANPRQRAKPTGCSGATQQETGEPKGKCSCHWRALSSFYDERHDINHSQSSLGSAVNTFVFLCVCIGYKNVGRGGGAVRLVLVAVADLQRSPGHFRKNKWVRRENTFLVWIIEDFLFTQVQIHQYHLVLLRLAGHEQQRLQSICIWNLQCKCFWYIL